MPVGKNYLIWGEQPGWIYYPWSDKYVPDPKAQKTYGESTGLLEKETKAKTNTVSPAGQLGAAALLSAVPIATKSLTGALLGEGGKEAATAAVGATSGGGSGLLAAGGQSAAEQAAAQNLTTMGQGGVETFGAEMGAAGAASPMFGSGGTIFNTEGMIGELGSFAPLNVVGAALGAYGAYDATKKQSKKAGMTQGALSGAAAGMSIGGPWGAGIGAVVGGLLGATAHESTKHRTNRRYDDLARTSSDAAFQKLLSEGREMSLAGKDTWDIGDDKASAPLDLMAKSYGVLKAFGPSWANYSPEQQRAVVQEMVNNDLINNKQGEWLVDDTERANQILQSVVGAPAAAAAAKAPASATTSNVQAPAGGPSIEDIANIIPWVELKDDETTTPAAPQAPAPVVAPAYTAMAPGVGGPQGLLAARSQQQQNPLKVNAIGGNKFLGGPLRFQ